MRIDKEKIQKNHLQNDQIEIVADDFRNNETVLKEIEKNTELLNAIESTYSRRLDKILTKIIKVMNKMKKADNMTISGNLQEKLKRLGLRYNKWNQGYWKKKINCEKVIYSLWNSIKSY